MQQYIEFKKQRELGEILSDTFGFMRNQFKPFFGSILKIVGPYILVMLISLGFYYYFMGDMFSFAVETSNDFFSPIMMLLVGFIFFFSIIAAYVMAQAAVLFYIESYANNKGVINFDEIRKNVYANFWNFIGLGLLVGISLVVGFIFCFIPGIYLYPILALSFSVMVFNKKAVSEAYGYSFTLIKDNWWITFATFLIIGIIVGVASYAFSIPTYIYMFVKMGTLAGEMDPVAASSGLFDPIYILLNVFSVAMQFLLNIITLVAGVFIYFNLNEKKNFTGTYERIENLGKS
ncbi:hypothetical protein M3P19_15025 [Muricauda sp. 2012CJ35-5]|uniref:Glycerophosphoryl diester phosphodiesterase membrane domain-containing protein n=1 Tax=Flagellimonas spongiicola TaxID=2942208 RepID=A0ABT0PV99_9FLAO|nr:hypothetical protein [Allomuricauda spongiicola]MCL6275328.1 hypothetical protein [Allomuricauda spongiicola]